MSRRTENLLSSIGSLYLAIVTFVSIYTYVGVSLFEHNQAVSNLVVLDKLLALRYLTHPSGNQIREARLNDLPNFFLKAAEEFIQEPLPPPEPGEPLESESDRADWPITKSAFTNAKIEGSHIRKIPMRLAAGATCDVLITELSAGHDFVLLVLSKNHILKSENIRLASLACQLGSYRHGNFIAFIFSLENSQYAFAVPEMHFSALKTPFGSRLGHIFGKIDWFKEVLPTSISKYVDLSESFVIIHIGTIEADVLSYANARLGKFFPAHELENVAQKLYEERETDASYLGITASGSLLVRLGPLVYLVLSFELWRRVRQLPVGKIRSERFWFGLDARDLAGRIYAYFCGFAPLLFGILIYVLFSVSQELGLVVFDRVVTLKGLATLQFPLAYGLDRSSDNFAVAVGLIVLPLQFLVSFLTVRKLVQVIRVNSR